MVWVEGRNQNRLVFYCMALLSLVFLVGTVVMDYTSNTRIVFRSKFE